MSLSLINLYMDARSHVVVSHMTLMCAHVISQVTFLGSWKFFSFIHYPLELQLTMASDSPDSPLTHTQESASKLKVLTLQPEGSLPSIVAADSLLGGVKFRIAGGDCPWSKIYPLGNSVQQWSKPHLLAEVICLEPFNQVIFLQSLILHLM